MTALFLKLVDIRFELVIGYILKTSGSISNAKMYYKIIEKARQKGITCVLFLA